MSRVLPTLLALSLSACASSQTDLRSDAADVAALASFEAWLAADDSATRALESWCAYRQLARPAVVAARRIGSATPPPTGLRTQLQISDGEPLGYRHVVLSCGRRELSVAHNWYVPSRLRAGMARQLETTDTPFGKVAAPLKFRREAFETEFDAAPECPRRTISIHRALLRLPDGRPLAYVIECYTRANLDGRPSDPPAE